MGARKAAQRGLEWFGVAMIYYEAKAAVLMSVHTHRNRRQKPRAGIQWALHQRRGQGRSIQKARESVHIRKPAARGTRPTLGSNNQRGTPQTVGPVPPTGRTLACGQPSLPRERRGAQRPQKSRRNPLCGAANRNPHPKRSLDSLSVHSAANRPLRASRRRPIPSPTGRDSERSRERPAG